MTIDEAEKIKTVVENKDYLARLVNTAAKAMIEAFENLKIEDVNMFQLGYNKAIDDFVANVKDVLITDYSVFNADDIRIFIDSIEDIAEQLKAGESE